ncbi:6004_t:CDS:2, partial [Acaulospora colombiana]
MYNRQYNQPNQTTPTSQRSGYPYNQNFPQQAQQALQHSGLSAHGTSSQFNAFNPMSSYNNSRMSNELRSSYVSSHQPQQQSQPTHIQSWHKGWSTDMGAPGGTNSQANHSMLSSSIYGSGGATGSNTGNFAQSTNSSLFGTSAQQQQQPQATSRRMQAPVQTIANRLGGDAHAYSSHQSPIGAPSITSLAAFHTSPTPAAQTPQHAATHNSSMLALPTPTNSSSVASSLLRQQQPQLYSMDTSNSMSSLGGMSNMASITSMGSLSNVGFQRQAIVNDGSNLGSFGVDVDTSGDLDTETLMENSMVSSSSLASNTPSAQTSISPNGQQTYLSNNINSRYSHTPVSSPSTSISSITDSTVVGHSSVASVNNPIINKRTSSDTNSMYGTSTISGMAHSRSAVYGGYMMSSQIGYSPQQSTTTSQQSQQKQIQQQLQQSQTHQQARSPYQSYTASPHLQQQQQQQVHHRSSISQAASSPN